MDNTTDPKRAMRDAIKRTLAHLSPTHRASAARSILTQLRALPEYQRATTILAYASLPTELDLDPFIRAALTDSKSIALPRVEPAGIAMHPVLIANLDDDVETGRYAIRSPRPRCVPADPHDLDLVLVPGLAFDENARRLGRGVGFYDRWIGAHPRADTTIVGIAYDEQLVDRVPTDAHDRAMDLLVTPTRVIRPPSGHTKEEA
jgi:5-formyltetrahydrofolate cyclo-ligase